jgi:hypothetical protein
MIAIKGGSEEKLELLIDGLGKNLVQNHYLLFPDIVEQSSNTDFKIIRCPFSDPRMTISDIASAISMFSETSLEDLKI